MGHERLILEALSLLLRRLGPLSPTDEVGQLIGRIERAAQMPVIPLVPPIEARPRRAEWGHMFSLNGRWRHGETHITRVDSPCGLCGNTIPYGMRIAKVRVGGDGTKAAGWRLVPACNRCMPVHEALRRPWDVRWDEGPVPTDGCPLCEEEKAEREDWVKKHPGGETDGTH